MITFDLAAQPFMPDHIIPPPTISLDSLKCQLDSIQLNDPMTTKEKKQQKSSLLVSMACLSEDQQGIKSYLKRAIYLFPGNADGYFQLGKFYAKKPNKFEKALYYYELAVYLYTNSHEFASPHKAGQVHADIGILYKSQGKYEMAFEAMKLASNLCRMDCTILTLYGALLCMKGEVMEAIKYTKRALDVNPIYTEALNNIAIFYRDAGYVDTSIQYFMRCIDLNKEHLHAYHAYLMSLLYTEDIQSTFNEHIKWGNYIKNQAIQAGVHRNALGISMRPHSNKTKYRIGYISPDFRNHSVSYFTESFMTYHDHEMFDFYYFHDSVEKDDNKTEYLKQIVEKKNSKWIVTGNMNEKDLLLKLRGFELDILIDLAGHSGNNRLHLFSCGLAKYHITYIGYPFTTGIVDHMNYRLVDCITDPDLTVNQDVHTETLIRFNQGSCFLCYTPSSEGRFEEKVVCQLCSVPVLGEDQVVFGCFNTLAKISQNVIDCWIQILDLLPQAILVLKSKALQSHEFQQQYIKKFPEIHRNRIKCFGMTSSTSSHLHMYQHIDIALDTFPYSGTTTTCEALFSSAPVITWMDKYHAQNVSASIIKSVNCQIDGLFDDLVANNKDDYVQKAVSLARNQERLKFLRDNLKEGFLKSPVCDGKRHTKDLEQIYLDILTS
jgi:protein O-GlcNAc transferase